MFSLGISNPLRGLVPIKTLYNLHTLPPPLHHHRNGEMQFKFRCPVQEAKGARFLPKGARFLPSVQEEVLRRGSILVTDNESVQAQIETRSPRCVHDCTTRGVASVETRVPQRRVHLQPRLDKRRSASNSHRRSLPSPRECIRHSSDRLKGTRLLQRMHGAHPSRLHLRPIPLQATFLQAGV